MDQFDFFKNHCTCTDLSPGVDQGQSQTYGGTHQGGPQGGKSVG